MDEVDCQTLENLHRLRQQNILSEAEYETSKAKILQKINPPEAPQEFFLPKKQDYSYQTASLFVSAFLMLFCSIFFLWLGIGGSLMPITYEIWWFILVGLITIISAILLLAKKDGPRLLPIITLMIVGSCFYWYIKYNFAYTIFGWQLFGLLSAVA